MTRQLDESCLGLLGVFLVLKLQSTKNAQITATAILSSTVVQPYPPDPIFTILLQ